MKFKILHQCGNRVRVHMNIAHMSFRQADILSFYLNGFEDIKQAVVYERTSDVVIYYECSKGKIGKILRDFTFKDKELIKNAPTDSGRVINDQYKRELIDLVTTRLLRKAFLPMPIDMIWTGISSIKFLMRGIKCLFRRKLEVEVLDALSIGVSIARGDFNTAGSVMFLLNVGEILENWTRKKSVDDLARCMSLNVDKAWVKTEDNNEVLMPISDIKKDDRIIVRTGNIIPLDGTLIEGEVAVNQASLTGEALSVQKSIGSILYAGTVVEEGECVIKVDKELGNSRYDNIVRMIEESEKLKSSTERKALTLADKLVPYTLLGTGLTYLFTRNITRTLSVLMVDFSCALKLSMPLAVLSAMKECGKHHITVKGGKFLEKMAKADTIVFDKTGTLTYANPKVAKIYTFGNHSEEEILRIAACLEEHYPHSIANAVVKEAHDRNIIHDEMHSKVEYVVAHGIASIIDGQRVVIGSNHFIFDDENCVVSDKYKEEFDSIPNHYSHLYLAIAGELVAVICIFDPLREEASAVVNSLKKFGIKRAVMMTGDSQRTARVVAYEVGVDDFYAEVLPEDKANFVKQEKEQGNTVIMIGDGINDSPALSEADVGIAISDGAAIAREIADITIAANNLYELVLLKLVANGLEKRIESNYKFVLGFNAALIALGVTGFIMPAQSALLHNLSTIGISLKSMTNLLD